MYPLVNIQKTIENGHRKFVDLPIKNRHFPWFVLYVYQAGYDGVDQTHFTKYQDKSGRIQHIF